MSSVLVEIQRLREYAKTAHENLKASDLDGFDCGVWWGKYIAYTHALYMLKGHCPEYKFSEPPPADEKEEFWRG